MPRKDAGRRSAFGRVVRLPWILLASGLWLWGCGGGGSASETATIDKDTFITTYVQLRTAEVMVDSARLDSARAAILHRAGVTQQDMLTFADVHGRDVAFMKDVWDEVEQRLRRSGRDSAMVH